MKINLSHYFKISQKMKQHTSAHHHKALGPVYKGGKTLQQGKRWKGSMQNIKVLFSVLFCTFYSRYSVLLWGKKEA